MDNKKKIYQQMHSMLEFNQLMTHFEDRFQKEIRDVYLNKRATNKSKRKRPGRPAQKARVNDESNHADLIIPHNISSISGVHDQDRLKLNEPTIPFRSSKRTAAKKAIEKTSLQLKQTLIEKLRNPGTSSNDSQIPSTSNKEKSEIKSLPVTDKNNVVEDSHERKSSKHPVLAPCSVILERCDNLFSLEKRQSNLNNNESESGIFKRPAPPAPVIPLRRCKVVLNDDNTSQHGCLDGLSISKSTSSKLLVKEDKDLGAQSVVLSSLCGNEAQSVRADTTVSDTSNNLSNNLIDGTSISAVSNNLTNGSTLIQEESKKVSPVQDNSNKSDSIVSTSTRPVRTKNRNKKYNEDEFYFAPNTSTRMKVSSVDSKNESQKNNVPDSSSTESNFRRGTKRKSNEDLKLNAKCLKLNKSKVNSEVNNLDKKIVNSHTETKNSDRDIMLSIGANTFEKQPSESSNSVNESENIESFHQAPETKSIAKQLSKTDLCEQLPLKAEIHTKESKKDKTTESKTGTDCSRTIALPISTIAVNSVVIVEDPSLSDKCVGSKKTTSNSEISSSRPEQRMTRTRTREINKKNQAGQDKVTPIDLLHGKAGAELISTTGKEADHNKNDNVDLLRVISTAELKSTTGKENKNVGLKALLSNEKAIKGTPLSSNILLSPTPSKSSNKNNGAKILLSSEKFMKMTPSSNLVFSPTPGKSHLKIAVTSHSKKPAIVPSSALDKKNEMIKAVTEDTKRKREEKERKILLHKQALEKEKQDKIAKLLKDKEEKEKAIAASKRAKEEHIRLKKLQTEAALKEAEERRLKEEETKLANFKKIEEEKRKLAQERQKQAEEAKKLNEKRLAEKEKELNMVEAAKLKKMKEKQNQVNVGEYELTPAREDTLPKPPKNENDYGISDQSCNDSSDDENHPKKVIPKWAAKATRLGQASIQKKIHSRLVKNFFPLNNSWQVHMNEVIISSGLEKNLRTRKSSALWNTPNSSSRV